MIVHDIHLRRWALEAREEINPNLVFKASRTWANNFKIKYRIVSRRITHKVGKDFWRARQDLEGKASNFVALVKQTIEEKGYSPQEVLNMDQSRFDKELHSQRSLADKGNLLCSSKLSNLMYFQGSRHVLAACGSKNATSHSYMVMPYVDMAGGLSSWLYVKSQEANGMFPQVRIPKIPGKIQR